MSPTMPPYRSRRANTHIATPNDLKKLARTLADWAAGKSITVFLFGSRVRGDHRPDSDVDIFVQGGAMIPETAVWLDSAECGGFCQPQSQAAGPVENSRHQRSTRPLDHEGGGDLSVSKCGLRLPTRKVGPSQIAVLGAELHHDTHPAAAASKIGGLRPAPVFGLKELRALARC
jgi:hypothetical protein